MSYVQLRYVREHAAEIQQLIEEKQTGNSSLRVTRHVDMILKSGIFTLETVPMTKSISSNFLTTCCMSVTLTSTGTTYTYTQLKSFAESLV